MAAQGRARQTSGQVHHTRRGAHPGTWVESRKRTGCSPDSTPRCELLPNHPGWDPRVWQEGLPPDRGQALFQCNWPNGQLLEQQHSAHLREGAGLHPVEVDATAHLCSGLIRAVPHGKMGSLLALLRQQTLLEGEAVWNSDTGAVSESPPDRSSGDFQFWRQQPYFTDSLIAPQEVASLSATGLPLPLFLPPPWSCGTVTSTAPHFTPPWSSEAVKAIV